MKTKAYKTEAAAQKAADRLSNKDPRGIYTVEKRGASWYVVFLGGLYSLLFLLPMYI